MGSVLGASVPCLVFLLFMFSSLVISVRGLSNNKYTFVKNASTFDSAVRFDYIIVGGGASGCPIAATLSERFSVLLLERGGSPYSDKDCERKEGFHMNLLKADNKTSPAEAFLSEDGIPGYRGRVLGGGTAVNAGFYSRASPEDVESARWEEDLVRESFEWVEKKVAFKPAIPAWQRSLKRALVETGLPDNGFTFEHKLGVKVGGVIFDGDGIRHSSADLLQYANASKIQVLLYATASRVLFDSNSGKRISRAAGVVFMDEAGNEHRAILSSNPRSEIILSAGALGSPQLLLLSGIGDTRDLQKLGIPVVRHLPSVGKRMGDNPNNAIVNVQRQGQPYSLIEVVGITPYESYVEELSGGEYAVTVFQALISLLKSPGKVVDLQALKKSADRFKEHYSQLVIIFQKIAGPVSRGELKLVSRRIEDTPSVSFNYYQAPEDLARCLRGVRTISNATRAPAYRESTYNHVASIPGSLGDLAAAVSGLMPKDVENDTAVEEFCRSTMTTIWHTHGGCVLDSVVDRDYRVLGTQGLRVVDISTFNSTPGTNPQATIMMLGRYMGVKILKARNKP